MVLSRSERLDQVSPRSSQSKVSKVNPRSGNASKGKLVTISTTRDGPTWSGIELLRAAKKY